PVDLQRPAESAGAVSALVDAVTRLQRAYQDRPGNAIAVGDDVEAVVHAVDQVDVGAAGRPEHDRRAGSAPARGVRGEIVRADVRFDLHDAAVEAAAGSVVDEPAAEQIGRHFK